MNLKKYLPFEKYTFTSKLTVEEIKRRLADTIEPQKGAWLSPFNRHTDKPYKGELVGDTFTISRVIHHKNSFLPIVTGTISTFLGQTQIEVKMQPAVFVLVFMAVWLGIVGVVCLGILLVGILQFREILQNGVSPAVLIPFGMFLFGSLLTVLAFKAESKKAKDFLTTLFESEVLTH